MKRLILWAMAFLPIAPGMAAASTFTYTNDPALFSETIDWCQLGGCAGGYAIVNTPTTWVSTSGHLSGSVGAFYSADPLLGLQQGDTWGGDFQPGMGVLYNWPYYNSNDIAITFDQLVYGAGAYVQPFTLGPFTATIGLFNNVYNIMDTYTWTITADQVGLTPGSALFIGAISSDPNVYGAIFEIVDQNGYLDFAIGQAGVLTVPEPATLLLVGASLLGVGVGLRRRVRS